MEEQILKEIRELKELIEKSFELNKDILTFNEALSYIGISKSTLYKLTFSKGITHYKPNGKLIFFKKKDLDKWVLQNKVHSCDEIERKVNEYLLKNPLKS